MIPPRLSNDWSQEIRHLYDHDMREMWDRSIAPHIWNQYHAQIALYTGMVKKLPAKTILDVGCAQGTLALLLAEAGYDVVANDIRKEFLEYAKTRHEKGTIEFIEGNIFDVKLDRKFDIIFANQILEHLVYPADFLKQIKLLLNDGGHVIVTTPNYSYFKNTLPNFSGIGDPAQYEAKQFSADADGHFFAYTKEELCGFATLAGFDDVSPFFFETPWISGHVKVRYLHRIVPARILRLLDRVTISLPIVGRMACHQLGIVARRPG